MGNPKVVDRFTAYCKRIAEELGHELEYVCTINEANMRLQISALIRDMGNRRMREGGDTDNSKVDASNVQVGINVRQENLELRMKETAEAFGIEDPTKVHTFVSQCTPEGDLLVMKAHEAARDAMKEVCPHLKIGLTLSLHDMQPYPGGEAFAEKEWDDEFLHYLPYIKNDDFLGVQSYSCKRFDANGVAPPAKRQPVTQMGYEDYPLQLLM